MALPFAFDGVANCGAGRVRLDVVEVERDAVGARAGVAHQRHLAVVGGRADETARREAGTAVGGAGRVHRRRLDRGIDRVPVALGRMPSGLIAKTNDPSERM